MESAEYALMDQAEGRMWWYRALHARILTALAPVRGAVLDIGCGTGGLLARIAAVRPDLSPCGVEYRPQAAVRAAAKSAAPIACASALRLPFSDKTFAAAILADVLCHAAVDPEAALAEVLRVLQPGGLLVVNMPAYAWLASAHDRRVHNARRLTAGALAADLARAGLVEVRAQYWNTLLLPFMVLQRKVLARKSDAVSRCRRVSAMDRRHVPRGHRRRETHSLHAAGRRVRDRHRPTTLIAQGHASQMPAPAPLAAIPARSSVGLSIVVPVYRGAATVVALVEALCALRPEGGMEIILVNDGSPDASDIACRAAAARATVPVIYVEHARNYGEHNAVMTGLRQANGAFVITMDDDLQNPPRR